MADLASVAKIPNVASAVLADGDGGFHDAIREPDGESVASVAAFVTTSLTQAGNELGLGTLRRVAIGGQKRALLVAAAGGVLVIARVDPVAALATVERAFDATVGKGG